jgi:hypothetical protein
VALVEDAGPANAVGIWFPNLPGCFSGGNDIDEALRNAQEALEVYAGSVAKTGPRPSGTTTVSALRCDLAVAADLRDHMIAPIALGEAAVDAAQ